MSADLEQLLREAAGTPRRELDLDGLEATVRRRRLRRRAGAALAAVIALAAVAVALPALLQPRVIIDTPAEPDGWPVLVRYVETRVDDGQAFEWEVGARGWTSWTMVRARAFNLDDAGEPVEPSPEGLALAREGEDRWAGTTYFLDEGDREGPFDLVAEALAGAWAERYPLEEHPDRQDAWLPLDAFVATPARPDDMPGDELVAADMPALRGEVAERLGLDPDDLVAFSIERDDGIQVTWVRHAASGLPLFYEEGMSAPPSIEDGAAADVRVRVDATDVRFDAELPQPTPLEPDPDVPSDEQTGVDEPEGPETAAAGDWRMLPDAPVPGRQNAGGVWTGDELLVWGGVPRAAGAAYDPESDAWRALPEAPLDPREWHVTVWTGSELIIWGGSAYDEPDDQDAPLRGGDFIGEFRADGAAYDPEADAWRTLADAPLDPRAGAAAVWTGDEVIIVSGTGEGIDDGTTNDFIDGAAYDPASDTWRSIPKLPDDGLREVGRDAVWTGTEMLVGGSRFASGIAAGYDPEADAWRVIDGGPLVGAGGFVAWTGDEAILTDTQLDGLAAYDPENDAWRELAPPPVESLNLSAVSFVAADGRLFAVGSLAGEPDEPMGAWTLDAAGESWAAFDVPPIADRAEPVAVWTGDELLVWSGTAVSAGHEAAAHDDGAAWRPTE